jgi:hypothetical protein
LAAERTRPVDLAFEQSDMFQCVENNAIVTDRANSYKKRYYRIDIIVGKILLRKHYYLFKDEHTNMMDLRYLCKLYDRRVALALIPFLQERLKYLGEEIIQK